MDPHIQGWRLSPLYDVMPRASLTYERRLHLGVGPEGRAATLDNAFAGHETFTLPAEVAARSIATIWRTVREWKVRFEEYQVPADQIAKIAPAFRHIDEVLYAGVAQADSLNAMPLIVNRGTSLAAR